MILNPEKLKKTADDDVRMFFEYDITKESEEGKRVVSFGYVKPSNLIIVGIVTTKDGVPELIENKDFDASTTGFDEATDYFESLIIKETSPQNQNQENENSAPPIGLLFVQENKSVKIVMQDGRKGDFTDYEYIVKDNILQINEERDGFTKNERFYVDVIPNSPQPNMFALYPFDEQKGGVTQEIDDYSGQDLKEVAKENRQAQKGGNEGDNEGGEPSGQGGEPSGQGGEPSGQGGEPSGQGGEPSGQEGDPSGQGGDPSGQGGQDGQGSQGGDSGEDDNEPQYKIDTPTAKQMLAKTYNMQELTDLLYTFGGKENLLNDLLNFTEMEKSGLLRKFGTEYQNDRQYESIIKSVIND
jgi:hypothetical protein